MNATTRMAGNLHFEPILVEDACATFDRIGPDAGSKMALEMRTSCKKCTTLPERDSNALICGS